MTPRLQRQIPSPGSAAVLPPVNIEEAGWDILLALHAHQPRLVTFMKLASLVSVPVIAVGQWIGWLQDRGLVYAGKHKVTGENAVILTGEGEALLDHYFSTISGLQFGTQH